MLQTNILAGLGKPEEIGSSTLNWPTAVAEQATRPRAIVPASEDSLALATSLQLRTSKPSVIVFAGTDSTASVVSLVEGLGRALVELGTADVLVLDFSAHHEAEDTSTPSPLEQVIAGLSKLDSILEESQPGLYVLSSASDHRRLAGQSAKALFNDLRKRFRYVLVAAPAYVRDFETRLLAQHADGIVLTLQQGRQGRARLLQIQRELKADRLVSLGFVLTGGPKR
jgi:hypothetical protein